MLVVVFIALSGIGLVQNVSWGPVCKDENPVFLTFLSGVSAVIAMVAVVLTVYGNEPQTALAVAGLIGTVLFNIVPIKKGLDYQAKAMYDKRISGFTKFKLGPVWAWFRHTLVGVGKCAKIVMYCTLIGIPAVKAMEHSERAINAYEEQVKLREMKEALDEFARINRAQAQDKAKK